MSVGGAALRLLAGAALLWWVAPAATAPEVPPPALAAAAAVALATLWRPGAGLLLLAALAPAASLLAPAPVRGAELLAWTLLAAWLLRVWQPLAPARTSWSAVAAPAALYAAALVASWVSLTLGGAAGVPPGALPGFFVQSIPHDYLIFSSQAPETWTVLQTLTGVTVLCAGVAILRGDSRLASAVAWAFVASLTVLAAATLIDIGRQWAAVDYGGWFLLRYLRGERASLHLRDLNAAGSLYVLAGLVVVALGTLGSSRRIVRLLPLAVIVPALVLTGSRTSFLAAVGGLLVLAVVQQRWPLTRRQVAVSAAAVCVALVGAAAVMEWQPDVPGSAGRAANLRSQFLETTVRMSASAPLSGVGIGRYFDRSPEFMPAALRELYGNENAHNYFAQQFAELGVPGGVLFLWLMAAIVAAGWGAVRTAATHTPTAAALLGLFAGVAAYLLTCVTGHPLLVPEASIPFWIACAALVSAHTGAPLSLAPRARTAIAVVACVLLAATVVRAGVAYARVAEPPSERGFHGIEPAPDGTPIRWMTKHAVTYIPAGAGFIRLRLQAPDAPMRRPLVVETSIAGEVVDRRVVPPDRWVTYDVPARRPGSGFRRVDLRANQFWTQETRLGRRAAQRPIAAMVGAVEWIPLEEVR